MRLLIASVAALAAVAFAAPSFAQDQDPSAAPVPTAKPKPGTAAYCQSLKTSSSRSSCLKKLSAKSTTKAPSTASAKKTKKTKTPASVEPKQPDLGQLNAPASTPTAAAPAGAVAVPPLPQKTI